MRSSRVLRLALLLLLLAGAALSCDSGGGGATEPGADTSLPDTEPSDDTAEDLAVVPSYPEGPYGVVMGETIANLEFYAPDTEGPVYLDQWYQHPEAKVILLVSTAAW